MRPVNMIHALLLVLAFMPAGCDRDDTPLYDAASNDYCSGFNAFLDRVDAFPVEPRDWGRMMLAAARLGYVTNECGDRVAAPREELCADLRAAMRYFEANEFVPRGDNRDSALRIGAQEYRAGRCEPPLDSE